MFAYLGAAALCGWNARRARGFPVEQRLWIALTLLLVALSINKQLDLQSWVTVAGRNIAKRDGWYARRQPVQVLFIVSLVVASAGLLAFLRYALGTAWRRYATVACGLALLLTFIVIRAATIHHIDLLLRVRFGVLTMNNVLELGAIALVALGAWTWRPPDAAPLIGPVPTPT
ncbi:MAG: hypothetical protein RL030_2604 [Pseudomonadota bacterium]